jgi:serine/threonine protein kinase
MIAVSVRANVLRAGIIAREPPPSPLHYSFFSRVSGPFVLQTGAAALPREPLPMSIACPYCKAVLNPKGLKPGRFQPKCPGCGKAFVLMVPDDPGGTISVQQLVAQKPAAAPDTAKNPVPQGAAKAKAPAASAPKEPPKPKRRKLTVEEHAGYLLEGLDPNEYGDPPDPESEAPPQPEEKSEAPAEGDSESTNVRPPDAKPPVAPSPSAPKDKTAPKPVTKSQTASAPVAKPQAASAKPAPKPAPQADPNATGDFTEAEAPKPVAKKSAPVPQKTITREPGADPNATGDFTEAEAPQAKAPAKKPGTKPAPKVDANVTGEFTASNEPGEREAPGEVTGEFTEAPKAAGEKKAAPGKAKKDPGRTVKPGESRAEDESTDDVPPKLGGYEVLKVLGRGGMGAVLLGRQISLDRKVALKVMHPKIAQNPSFVARFTREAYAAAQLTHHNVIQIYDIGEDKGQHFFSMEFVQGHSLMDVVKHEGKLAPDVAVGYILQAARGLKYGHNQGMVHRDIKPDNLMLNTEGIVKVADLGLVKLPGGDLPEQAGALPSAEGDQPGDSNLTRAGAVMGTPAYMSPEQSTDSAAVDARADVYSLGCTLYVLITGKPPFEGKTALEIISKHQTEPIVPPEVVVKRVPPALSAILLKMLAKKPEDRHQSMDEVISALEGFLGLERTGAFNPKEEQADLLEKCAHQFQFRSKAGLKRTLSIAFFAACLLGIVGAAFAGMASLAGGLLGLAVMTPVAYFVVSGVLSGSVVFTRVRGVVFGMRFFDWIMWLGGALLFLTTLLLFGLLWSWLGFAILAVGLAFLLWFITDRAAAKAQEGPLDETRGLLRTLRLQGTEEEAVRQFVCKFAGQHWEPLYEALFSYEAMIAARASRKGDTGETWKKYATWRDPVVLWADARMEARRLAKERAHLQKVEVKALVAEGVSSSEAKAQAEEMAGQMVDQAEAANKARKEGKEVSVKELVESARKRRRPEPGMTIAGKKHRNLWFKDFVNNWFGRRLRLVLGAAVFAAGLLWLNQNDLLKDNRAITSLTEGNIEGAQQAATAAGKVATRPLTLPGDIVPIPADLKPSFNTWALPITGLLLLLNGVFYFGWRPTLVTLPGAAVALFGPLFGIPAVDPLTAQHLSLIIGAVLILVVARFLRQ